MVTSPEAEETDDSPLFEVPPGEPGHRLIA
jgi:hypothetical protein